MFLISPNPTHLNYFDFVELRPNLAVQIHYTENGGITGHFMVLIMLIMYVSSVVFGPPISSHPLAGTQQLPIRYATNASRRSGIPIIWRSFSSSVRTIPPNMLAHFAHLHSSALYAHATGCFVRDTPNPAWTKHFPFYDPHHCLGYESWRFIVWPFLLYFGERIWREVRGRKFTKLTKVLVHPSGRSP